MGPVLVVARLLPILGSLREPGHSGHASDSVVATLLATRAAPRLLDRANPDTDSTGSAFKQRHGCRRQILDLRLVQVGVGLLVSHRA